MQLYKFENLVLLSGTNPLPNYVIADYFLKINQNLSNIWLIYSKENNLQGGTLTYAENLETIISRNFKSKHKSLKFPLEMIGLSDVSHARTIKNEIMESRITKVPQNEQFHLNYTGGTKSMSVHIYWILRELFGKKSENISFSYLDARNFRLVDDKEEQIIDSDLRKKVSLSFTDLIELHGFQIKERNTNPVENSTQLFNEYFNPNTTSERKKEIKSQHGGHWLEGHVTALLDKWRTDYFKIENNLRMKRPFWQDKTSDFEVDIMLVNGYHLTGISCTVKDGQKKGDQKECKMRGFEVILRTKQIGGDESKSILITFLDNKKTKIIQDELIYDTGGNTENIKVFGIEDIKREDYFFKEMKRFIFNK